MPPQHKLYKERWNPGRLINWGLKIGFNVARLMKAIMESKKNYVQGYRSCIAILNLSKVFSHEEVDKACGKACDIRAYTVKSIESIIKNKLYLTEQKQSCEILNKHNNIRGKQYYKQEEEFKL